MVEQPSPAHYKVLGEFDYKDAKDLKNTEGKLPRFYIGIKTKLQDNSIDNPGPGTY
jgi:hypothetical protein